MKLLLRTPVAYRCGHPGNVEFSGGEYADHMRKLAYLQAHAVCSACERRREAVEIERDEVNPRKGKVRAFSISGE